MAAIDDLASAVSGLSASVDAAIAALGTAPANDTAQLVALTTDLTAVKAKLDTAVAAHSTPPAA